MRQDVRAWLALALALVRVRVRVRARIRVRVRVRVRLTWCEQRELRLQEEGVDRRGLTTGC